MTQRLQDFHEYLCEVLTELHRQQPTFIFTIVGRIDDESRDVNLVIGNDDLEKVESALRNLRERHEAADPTLKVLR